jgi:DNA-binding transcriptional regulator YdaS (Cro superfamily)
MRESPVEKAFRIVGGQSAMASRLGISREAVRKWKRQVPAERVLEIEHATDGQVSRHDLRPDIYPRERRAI